MRNYFFDEVNKLKKETTVSGNISSIEAPLKKKMRNISYNDEDDDEQEENEQKEDNE